MMTNKRKLGVKNVNVIFIEDVARLLGMSPSSMYRYVRAGIIPGEKIGGGWCFSPQTIAQLQLGARVDRKSLIEFIKLVFQSVSGLAKLEIFEDWSGVLLVEDHQSGGYSELYRFANLDELIGRVCRK